MIKDCGRLPKIMKMMINQWILTFLFWDLSLLFGMITKRISGKSPVHVARRILRHAKIMAADYESGLDMELYEVQMLSW